MVISMCFSHLLGDESGANLTNTVVLGRSGIGASLKLDGSTRNGLAITVERVGELLVHRKLRLVVKHNWLLRKVVIANNEHIPMVANDGHWWEYAHVAMRRN